MPEIVARRRVIRRTADSTGLSVAIALALAIVALLALLALARGAFNPISTSQDTTPAQNQIQPSTNPAPAGGAMTY